MTLLPPRGVLLAVLLLWASPVRADSVIVGAVVNAVDRKPMPDVVVIASSPALTEERLILTDGQGQYRFPQLPPGTYTLRFDKVGFRLFTRPELQLRPDRTLRVNVELLPEGINPADIPPPSDSPPKLGSGFAGCTGGFGGDFVKRIPVNRPGRGDTLRPFQSLLAFAPPGALDASRD